MKREFLGIGWKYPVKFSDQRKIALSYYDEDVQESIWIILSTAPGERLMLPDFGCGIHDYVFAPNNTHTAGMVRFHVQEALTHWEPRIILQEVQVEVDPSNPSVLLIQIEFKVRATDSRYNLVYPFYLERGKTS